MKNKAQLESLFISLISILLILSLIIYYFQFKTGVIPVFKPKKNIEPAERGILPKGTFFEEKKPKDILPYLFFNKTYAQTKKKYKINKNLETYIINPSLLLTILENDTIKLIVSGKNKSNLSEKIYFQYKIEPLHNDWQIIYNQQKNLLLPKEKKLYTLYVRAINKNLEVDPTPAIAYIYVNISPFYKDISIETNFNKDRLVLKNISKNTIDVSNWKIISSKINFSIPKAAEDIPPNLIVNLKNISLKPRERLIIYNQSSPLGFSFKINKCLRYLNYNLKDYLKNYFFPCDRLSKDKLIEYRFKYRLNNKCLEILEKISCSGPKPKDWEKIINNSPCYNFFENYYTYRGCYENKKGDPDFYLKEWLIFFPTYDTLTNKRYEEIKLYDQDNLLVNKKIVY